MSINWKHEKLDMNQKTRPKSKIKWDKVDKDLYKAITDKEALKLQESIITDSLESQEVVERMNDILTTASQNSSGNKTIYQSRPKLKVWNSDIKNALKEKTDYVQRMAKKDINVNGATYSGDKVIEGFKEHFCTLSTLKEEAFSNPEYHSQVEMEISNICKLVDQETIRPVIENDVRKAISTINRNKSADYHNITIEHFIYAGDNILSALTQLINIIFLEGDIPTILKIGLLSPVFKNKGSKNDALNYRGITILPVESKIIEAIIRDRVQPKVQKVQNPTQRGFTKGSSPMNAALPVEEMYRILPEKKQNGYLVLLDAKAAFDTVVHSHLFRRVYHAGIQDRTWTIIRSLHQNAESSIKWSGKTSERFTVGMGVRQGGILSTDLYKLYINPLLDHFQNTTYGMTIGNVNTNNTGCADDIAILSMQPADAQIMVNMALDFANSEGYQLQPKKSVVIKISGNSNNTKMEEDNLMMGNTPMPNVEQATHLGIIRTTTRKNNIQSNTNENITKARRSAYSLLGAGFHGHNGLDPESLLHIYKTYILPVLLYGMELLTPSGKPLEQLEIFQKRMLKQILSLPTRCPDPAVYILTGILPVEAQIHIKTLTFFNNICHQSEESTEKKLARRQLTVCSEDSNSWFIHVNKLLRLYDLSEANTYLANPTKKTQWITLIKNAVMKYWSIKTVQISELYLGLKYLSSQNLIKGKLHPILQHKSQSALDNSRIPTRLRLITGTYVLQTKRIQFYRQETDPTCLLCGLQEETLEHFVMQCEKLQSVRAVILKEVNDIWQNEMNNTIRFHDLDITTQMQLLLDSAKLINLNRHNSASVARMENHSRNLFFKLHIKRNVLLDEKT
ncbi:Hypothetical predicted protein [Mytilus galloprovincialis]|uniref:Reverse transcriptase domain-containing protein n=1 Tax=Mytilus galloprovincialis TaxID=29158 RepID=A0A8B6DX33_MYTGA|nr:Hypothetical predicted protein [Mytilus galloprovincialis]